MKGWLLTLFFLFSSGAVCAGCLDEFEAVWDKSPSMEKVFSDCADKTSIGSSAGVRACSVSINRHVEIINAANATLKKLKSTDASRIEGMSSRELKDAIEFVSDMKQLAYVGAGVAYTSRGYSQSEIDPRKARHDCTKADEIRRYLKDNSFRELVDLCEQVVSRFGG